MEVNRTEPSPSVRTPWISGEFSFGLVIRGEAGGGEGPMTFSITTHGVPIKNATQV